MADSPEPTNATPTEAAAAPTGGKSGLLMTVGGAVAGLALGTVIGFFLLGPRLAPASPKPADAKGEQQSAASGEAHSESHGDAEGDSAHKLGEPRPIYSLDNLVLNPAGSNGTRFLLVSVAFEAKDEATVAQLKGRDAELRDAVLRMFGTKTVEQVAEASLRDQLRADLLASISKLVPAGSIKKVYFPQFVIQ